MYSLILKLCALALLVLSGGAAGAGMAAFPAAADAVAPRYRATVVLGNERVWPPVYGGINNAGQIIGNIGPSETVPETGFVTIGDLAYRFGLFRGRGTTAIDINNAGQVVGTAGQHGFVWEGGAMRGIGTLGGSWAAPSAINDAGQIVGLSATASGAAHAFLYQNGQMRDLTAMAPFGYEIDPRDINNQGQITGAWRLPDEERHAFFFDGGQWTDIGTLGGSMSVGTALNEAGQIVGASHVPFDQLEAAFLYTPGEGMREIARNTLGPATANDINNSGVVVGIGIGFYPLNSFITDANGTRYMDSLLDGSAVLSGVAFINDAGQISVNGCGIDQGCGLLRLDPVPEPSTWLMLLGGVALLAWRSRRRQGIGNAIILRC